MQLTFDYYDIQKALELLVTEKLGVSLDLEDVSHADYPSIKYKERVVIYKKHKNGKEVKDEHGFREVDWDNTEYVTKHVEFDDSAEFTIYVSGERQ
tara:strand:+ start:32 stop:319 length:288 start_codon:yes stop_codon:yes gene_type:complete